MKSGIHPTYYDKVTVTCVCGNTFETGSTISLITTEICSHCHPFYTGKKKFVDTGGRVDRFKKLTERAAQSRAAHAEVKKKRAAKVKAEKKVETKEKQAKTAA